ncbi:hypothetical protein F2Q70_00038843 [Brassica cretica]|uniref:O-methyltransferase C-terminal domain-containing protein n=1 Tax=Brassica cretica TaxID=69181 RepID=A0A8S9K9P0_BRACR|nr:hypothetical protein F2Q70_00038843 [Brassica cretica]KAF2619004.1 hypothetical protein F2Q68_00039529 [Brassica cretica]
MEKNENIRAEFNEAMLNHTSIVMKKILKTYNGFNSLSGGVLVDVGGGLGANLALILSRLPKLKGVNFDLPHVVSEAPKIKGVEHVGGDMFDAIPRGQAIFMKGGKERTKEEFEVLAMKAGFNLPNIIYGAYSFWILELYAD